MLLSHDGHCPEIDPAAYVAPDATICGNVTIGAGSRIMHGARIIAEGGKITLGPNVIVMQNAVVRSISDFDCRMESNVLVGPTAHIVGATIESNVFLATGTAIFHGSRIESGSVVRIHGVVHVNSVLERDSTVPIGGVAVGSPASVFTSDQEEEIWEIQKELGFTKTAYGIEGALNEHLPAVTRGVSERMGSHVSDRLLDAR